MTISKEFNSYAEVAGKAGNAPYWSSKTPDLPCKHIHAMYICVSMGLCIMCVEKMV
jgi:hypothetical protein